MDSGSKAAQLSSVPPRSHLQPQHPLPPIAPKHSSSSSERPCRSPLSKSHSPQKKKAQPNGPCLTVVLLPTPYSIKPAIPPSPSQPHDPDHSPSPPESPAVPWSPRQTDTAPSPHLPTPTQPAKAPPPLSAPAP